MRLLVGAAPRARSQRALPAILVAVALGAAAVALASCDATAPRALGTVANRVHEARAPGTDPAAVEAP